MRCYKGKCNYLDSPYIAVLSETDVEIQDMVDMTIFLDEYPLNTIDQNNK